MSTGKPPSFASSHPVPPTYAGVKRARSRARRRSRLEELGSAWDKTRPPGRTEAKKEFRRPRERPADDGEDRQVTIRPARRASSV